MSLPYFLMNILIFFPKWEFLSNEVANLIGFPGFLLLGSESSKFLLDWIIGGTSVNFQICSVQYNLL